MAEALNNAGQRALGFRQVLEAMLAGGSNKEAIAPWQSILDDSRPEDLVMVVDAAVADGIDFIQLKPAVSRLINLMHASLVRYRHVPQPGELFFSSLMAENRCLMKVLEQGKAATKALNDPDPAIAASGLAELSDLVSRLESMEIHFRKKENVLFPWFEARYQRFRCVRLMWDIHDDARKGFKNLANLLEKARDKATGAGESAGEGSSADGTEHRGSSGPVGTIDRRPINAVVGKLYFDLNTNLFREECSLFPVMASIIPKADGLALFVEAHEYGYAFLDEAEEADYSALAAALAAAKAGQESTGVHRDETSAIQVPGTEVADTVAAGFSGRTGSLPPEILGALFSTIHLDLTWVDADDKVRWFSDSPRRIFPRSPSIIGRDVRNCHPGASVGRVVAILEDFKAGRKDREAFWLAMKGRFIHIEYFALRSPYGSYLGTLEASEDLTEKRRLEGEKRLVE
ncbi:MAG: PAS domain-containing protein [Spirochaetota bacterium]